MCQDSYHIFRKDRNNQGGGVALLIRNDLTCSEIEIETGPLEILCLNIKGNRSNIIVVCCYKPSVADVHLLAPLKKVIKCLTAKKLPILLMGDFNLPDITWDRLTSPTSKAQSVFLNMFISFGLYQKVLEPTRGSAILDLLFVNEPLMILNDPKILPPLTETCDHSIVTFDLNINPARHDVPTKKYDWNKLDSDLLFLKLNDVDWDSLLGISGDINFMWDSFSNFCSGLINQCVPFRLVSTQKNFSSKRLYSNKIKNLLVRKHALYKIF